jgi:hypothetical protein
MAGSLDVANAEMEAYDLLPKFARDWLKDNCVSPIDIYMKYVEYENDDSRLKRFINSVKIEIPT